jgi:hypothetical protein
MPGYFVFDPDSPEIGLSTGPELAVAVFLDIKEDILYFTDATNIYQWEGHEQDADKTYTWRSRKIRFPQLTNLGAAMVEAESYDDITFNLYADGVLKHTQVVRNIEPFRLPGGFLSNIFEIELIGTDVVSGVSIAETVFDLVEG